MYSYIGQKFVITIVFFENKIITGTRTDVAVAIWNRNRWQICEKFNYLFNICLSWRIESYYHVFRTFPILFPSIENFIR